MIFVLSSGAPGLLADGDTGWHIRTGQWILQQGRVPRQDLFSFTKAGQPWFAWEWLWDVAAAGLQRWGGLPALVLASSLLIAVTFLALYRFARTKSGNAPIAFFLTLLAVLACSWHWLARPHLVTLPFTLLFAYVLERARGGRQRWLIWLPFLTVLWTNLHGGFLAGILLVGLYTVGELLTVITGTSIRAVLIRSGPYALSTAACVLASFANPYGAGLHVHLFRYLTDPFYAKYISEFQPLLFPEPASRIVEALMLLGAVAAYRQLRLGHFVYPLIFVAWLHMALTSARHAPIFVILITPWIAADLSDLIGALVRAQIHPRLQSALASFREGAAEFSHNDRVERFYVTSILAILGLAAALYSASPMPKFRAEFDPRKFPVEAAAKLVTGDKADPLFSTDLWGGYLIYRHYPALKVFIDGRSDFYGPAFVKSYLDVVNAQPGWDRQLERYKVSRVLIPVGLPLASVLKESKNWRLVSDDGVAVLFEKAG